MNNISFMLMADTYKNTNPDAMPEGLTRLVSYITPRKSMFLWIAGIYSRILN